MPRSASNNSPFTGERMYECGECRERQWVRARELTSRSRLRCCACGSLFLSPTKGSAADRDIARHEAAMCEQRARIKAQTNRS